MKKVTFEEFMAQYMSVPMDIKQSMLDAGMKMAQSIVEHNESEPYVTLTELAPKLGYQHSSSLWRLGIKAASENFGGRPRYKVSKAMAFLRSQEGAAVRDELRAKRRAQAIQPGTGMCPQNENGPGVRGMAAVRADTIVLRLQDGDPQEKHNL